MLLGIYLKKLKTYIHTRICTWMFIAALFIIPETWKQPRCPSVGDWLNKLCSLHTMDYYLVLKGNEISSHERTCRDLKCLLLSKGSWKYFMISIIQRSRKGKTMESRRISGGVRGWVQERGEEWIGGAQKISRAVKIISMMPLWWIYVIHLSKPIEFTAQH